MFGTGHRITIGARPTGSARYGFFPRCSCGWSGYEHSTEGAAAAKGREHVAKKKG